MTLLSDILAYCERTRSAATALGTAVMRDTSLVNRLRKGARVRADTEDRVRRYMAEHPDGVRIGAEGRQPIPRPRSDPAPAMPDQDIIDRNPCWRCGTRGDIGCECPK